MGTELQQMNGQSKLAEWAAKIAECRNSGTPVSRWCKENGVCEQTYYKWQRRLFAVAKEQQETRFAEVTPVLPMPLNSQIAITVRGNGIAADIHNGADVATVEAVMRLMRLC